MRQNLAELAADLQNTRTMEIDLLIEDPAWDGLEAVARRSCTTALAHLGMEPGQYAVSILGCDDDRIARLNQDFRGKAQPTNVLSWPAVELSPPEPAEPGELGDIAIAHGTCTREARDQGKPFEHHVAHLLVHATLHLLGYDHQTDADADEMESIETAVLATMGILTHIGSRHDDMPYAFGKEP